MSGTGAQLATRALIAHLLEVLVTRVEENSNPANADCVPFNSFCPRSLKHTKFKSKKQNTVTLVMETRNVQA